MNDKEQKKPIWMWVMVITLALIGMSFVNYLGYAIEENADPQIASVMNIINGISAICNGKIRFSPIAIVGAFIHGNGITRKACILSALAAGVGLLYFYNGNGKRFHKKGIEHGSAKWGSQQEKNIIADTTPDGFYNNVIVASDVFLVLDRKQRDKNEHIQMDKKSVEKKDGDK